MPNKLYRCAYAVTSTAVPANIRQHLVDIQKIGDDIKTMNEIRGVLIYGNGYFLHCFEGS